MTTDEMPTGEKEPTHWDAVVGDERDAVDIGILEEEYGAETTNAAMRRFPPGSGFIQRQGSRPRGYMLFEVTQRDNGEKQEPSLLIKHFYTNKDVRGIGSFRTIIRLFREQAEKRNCPYVMWEPMTLMEVQLTKRMGMKREGRYYVIPTKELDIYTILDRI